MKLIYQNAALQDTIIYNGQYCLKHTIIYNIVDMMASVFLFALLQNYGNSVDCVTYSNTNAKEKRKCIL